MKKFLLIGGGSLLLLVALLCGAVFASPMFASAHGAATPTKTPATTTTPKGKHVGKHLEYRPLRVFTRNHADALVDAIAPQLHLTAAQLTDKLKGGERLVKIAKAQGVSAKDLRAILIKSTDAVIDHYASEDKLTKEQAADLTKLVHEHPFFVGAVLHHHFDPKHVAKVTK